MHVVPVPAGKREAPADAEGRNARFAASQDPGLRRGLQGNDPMILVLSRGHFCPKDNQQHLELAANYPKIAVAPVCVRGDLSL